jgi:hypothetical protein
LPTIGQVKIFPPFFIFPATSIFCDPQEEEEVLSVCSVFCLFIWSINLNRMNLFFKFSELNCILKLGRNISEIKICQNFNIVHLTCKGFYNSDYTLKAPYKYKQINLPSHLLDQQHYKVLGFCPNSKSRAFHMWGFVIVILLPFKVPHKCKGKQFTKSLQEQ